MTSFTGLRPLLAATLHQDRRHLAPWVVVISVLSASSILVYAWVITETEERSQLATSIGANPAMALVFGRPDDLMTADGFNAWRAGTLGLFFAGLMTVLAVVRSSRALEDSGQAELVAAAPVGRRTRLAVALLVAWAASLLLGLVCLTLTVLCGGALGTSALLAATFACAGAFFAGVAALAAQVGAQARTATSLAVGVLGTLFAVRGYVDAGDSPGWAVWSTPFGWLQETRPAGDARVWPLALTVGAALALALLALALEGGRDLGQGLLAPRRGPARGGRSAGLWGLTWQLHRGTLATWLLAFAVLGFLLGTLAASMGDVIASSPVLSQVLASGAASRAGLTEAFLATVLQLVGIVAAVTGVQVVMRSHAEEDEGRVEPLLAGSLSRRRLFAATAVTALLTTAVAMAVAGTVIAAVTTNADPDTRFRDVLGQALVTVPAVWLLVGIALAVVGAHPQRRIVGWLAVVATFALTILGPTFRLWEWALDLSPFRHVPAVTSPTPEWGGLVALTLLAAMLIAVGLAGFSRRDLGTA